MRTRVSVLGLIGVFSVGCGGADGKAGKNGKSGSDALVSLVRVSNEPAGGNCAEAGLLIETGVDENENGTLDAEEIDSATYACNGVTGTPGINGIDGDNCIIEKNGRCPGGDLRGIDLRDRDLSGIDLSGADLSYALLDRVDFSGATLTNTVFDYSFGIGYNGSVLLGGDPLGNGGIIDFRNADMLGASFVGAVLSCFTFQSANLANAVFDDAILTGPTGAATCDGEYVSFENASMPVASFRRTILAPGLSPYVSFRFATANNVHFDDAYLEGLRMDNSNFNAATFTGATLFDLGTIGTGVAVAWTATTATFDFASIEAADFTQAALTSSTYANTYYNPGTVTGILFPLTAIDLSGGTQTTKNFSRWNAPIYPGSLAGKDFTNAIMPDVNLENRNLLGTNFAGADLTRANMRGTTLGNGASGATANFNGATLIRADLRGATFDTTSVGGVTLVNFQNADLTEAWLTNTDFNGADLSGADLTRASLIGTDFDVQALDAAVQITATTSGTTSFAGAYYNTAGGPRATDFPAALPAGTLEIVAGGDHSSDTLIHAHIPFDMDDTNFTLANLSDAYFGDAGCAIHMTGANFTQANLSKAILQGADLSPGTNIDPQLARTKFINGANLTDANLAFTILDAADFSAGNLTRATLLGARTGLHTFNTANDVPDTVKFTAAILGDTICPDGLANTVDPGNTCNGHDIDPTLYPAQTYCP